MRCLALALALLLAIPAHAAKVGAYIWGGQLTTRPGILGFYDSVNLALTLGFDSVRFAITPSSMYGADRLYFGVGPDPCAGHQSLGCYARIMFASSAWDNPGLKYLQITSQDWTLFRAGSGTNSAYLDPVKLTANAAAAQAEYADLIDVVVGRLGARVTSGEILIVLSNWEGENFIYCGSSGQFANNQAGSYGGGAYTNFVPWCQSTWPVGQTNAQRVQAFLQWVAIKDAAVAAAKIKYPSINIASAPEFNSWHTFESGCSGYCDPATDRILRQIELAGGREYCSYSSYNSRYQYVDDITYMLTICHHMIIGEAGVDLLGESETAAMINFNVLAQLRDMPNVSAVFPWNFVNMLDNSQYYGLLWPNGSRFQIELMGNLKPTPQAVPQHK